MAQQQEGLFSADWKKFLWLHVTKSWKNIYKTMWSYMYAVYLSFLIETSWLIESEVHAIIFIWLMFSSDYQLLAEKI